MTHVARGRMRYADGRLSRPPDRRRCEALTGYSTRRTCRYLATVWLAGKHLCRMHAKK